MDEQTRVSFRKEFNRRVGELLASARSNSGLTLEYAVEGLLKRRIEKLARVEAGEESIVGSELFDLAKTYGVDPTELHDQISQIAEEIKARVR